MIKNDTEHQAQKHNCVRYVLPHCTTYHFWTFVFISAGGTLLNNTVIANKRQRKYFSMCFYSHLVSKIVLWICWLKRTSFYLPFSWIQIHAQLLITPTRTRLRVLFTNTHTSAWALIYRQQKYLYIDTAYKYQMNTVVHKPTHAYDYHHIRIYTYILTQMHVHAY